MQKHWCRIALGQGFAREREPQKIAPHTRRNLVQSLKERGKALGGGVIYLQRMASAHSFGQDSILDGKFKILRKLGEGGMSQVWEAENVLVKKRVAIKVMNRNYAEHPKALARFRNEATSAGRIGSPHICDILDFGQSGSQPYIVMECLVGRDLGDLLRDVGKIDPRLAVLLIRQGLTGLDAAHQAGIVHRDLKPENVFLHEPEPGAVLVKLMDFGISKFSEGVDQTQTGLDVVMGTPEYMSPEQAEGAAKADERTDIWAIGVILYRAITGQEPFRGHSVASTLLALTTKEPTPILDLAPDTPPGLVRVVMRCMEKLPERRYQSVAELSEALAPYELSASTAGQTLVAVVRDRENKGKTEAYPEASRSGPFALPLETAPTGIHAGGAEAGVTAQESSVAAAPEKPPTVEASFSSELPSGIGGPDAAGGQGLGTSWSSEQLSGDKQTTNGTNWSIGDRDSVGQREISDERPYDERPKRSSGGAGRWVGVALALALLGGGGWWIVNNGGEASTETGTVSQADAPIEETQVPAADSSSKEAASENNEPTPEEPAQSDDASPDPTENGAEEQSPKPTPQNKPEPEPEAQPPKNSSPPKNPPTKAKPPAEPKVNKRLLAIAGNLATPKQKGDRVNYAGASSRCRKLSSKRYAGLKGWRLPSESELLRFRGNSDVVQTKYWLRSGSGSNASALILLSQSVKELPKTDKTARVLCVAKVK